MNSQLGTLLPDGQPPADRGLEDVGPFPSRLLEAALEISRHRRNILAQLKICLEAGEEKKALKLAAANAIVGEHRVEKSIEKEG